MSKQRREREYGRDRRAEENHRHPHPQAGGGAGAGYVAGTGYTFSESAGAGYTYRANYACTCRACQAGAERARASLNEDLRRVLGFAVEDGRRVHRQSIPILAQRAARLNPALIQRDEVRRGLNESPFQSLNGRPFQRIQQAECIGAEKCRRSPTWRCTCGFYSVQAGSGRILDYVRSSGGIYLDVQLYGKVIEHEQGYRAEWQEVLGAHVSPCLRCRQPRDQLYKMTSSRTDTWTTIFALHGKCESYAWSRSSYDLVPLDVAKVEERIGFALEFDGR